MTDGSRKAIIAALLANLGIAAAKFLSFAFTGAASMLAEGVHSLADTGNQALLIFGGTSAQRRADEEHPFGYGRVRYFWAFVVAVVLFSLGGLFATVEGIEKLLHPHEVSSIEWALGVLAVAIALESWSFRTAIHEARPHLGRDGWWAFIRHSKAPELPVVLLEDFGALIGLILATLGVSLAWWTGEPRWDALGSIAIGLLLGVIAVVLAIEMKSLLIGEGAAPEVVASIRDALAGDPDVTHLIHLKTLHLGPDELLVTAKVALAARLASTDVAAVVNRLEAAIRGRVAAARLIFIEPDVWDAARAAGAPPAVGATPSVQVAGGVNRT